MGELEDLANAAKHEREDMFEQLQGALMLIGQNQSEVVKSLNDLTSLMTSKIVALQAEIDTLKTQ